mgnify:CR=1 FL=1
MRWVKKGLIFNAKGQRVWMKTHAALPLADHIENNVYKIYFSTRNDRNQASPGYIIIELSNPSEILELSKLPILKLGKLGSFDESGIMPTSLVNVDSKKYLFYVR